MSNAVAHLLWEDSQVFAQRYEKSACALTAIYQALSQSIQVGAIDDFCEDYRLLAALPADAFTQVWLDPTAYAWMRLAYELTQVVLAHHPLSGAVVHYQQATGLTNTQALLIHHLHHFKRFLLAAAYQAGVAVSLRIPFAGSLPLALPGTILTLVGTGRLTISGWNDGQLQIGEGAIASQIPLIPGACATQLNVRVEACPVICRKGIAGASQIRLQPSSFQVPGLVETEGLTEDLPAQHPYMPLLEAALDLVQQHQPTTFTQLLTWLQVFALKPLSAGSYTNLSHSHLPGALICSIVQNPWEMADTLIHEFHHNRLFCLEDGNPILVESTATSAIAGYYSPWRDDLRPLRGLLHALYVYVPVARFWQAVYHEATTPRHQHLYATSQWVRIVLQLQLAVSQLLTYGQFTAFGERVFGQLQQDVESLALTITTLSEPLSIPALYCHPEGQILPECDPETQQPLTVRDAIAHHQTRYDSQHQCQQFLAQMLYRQPVIG